jgi:sec-independent protein translocase protein TatC
MPEEHAALSFWDHLTEFMKRLKVVLFTFAISVFILLVLPGNTDFFAFTNNYAPLMSVVLVYIRNMMLPPDVKLIATSMSDPITLYVFAAVAFAIVITLPVFAYEVYKFVVPALYPHEKKAIVPFVSVVTLLFIGGAIFGFLFLAPAFIQGFFPFYSAVGAEPWLPLMDFYSTLFFTVIISGFLFTIPAFFVLLVKFGFIHTKMFAKKRKYIYAALVIGAMLISPGATPQGDLYLFIALALMFEISMLAATKAERKGTPDNVPAIFKIFSNRQTCKFCHTETDANLKFCPNCRRVLS